MLKPFRNTGPVWLHSTKKEQDVLCKCCLNCEFVPKCSAWRCSLQFCKDDIVKVCCTFAAPALA